MLMVRFDGRRVGSRGDRKGEAGADIGSETPVDPGGTLRLRFFAFRGRLGGEGERCGLLKASSGVVVGDTGVHSM